MSEPDHEGGLGDAPPEKAVDYILRNARTHAKAKARRRHLEEFRKSKKALLMNACSEKSYAAKETFAYSHADYIALLDGIEAAIEAEETIHWKMRAAEMAVEIWRSRNANERAEGRVTR